MKAFLLISFIAALHVSASEPADVAFKSRLDGSEQRYVELLPPAFDAAKAHDVVVVFHGHGSDRWQFIKTTGGECQGVRDEAAKFGLIMISPDYRAKTSWMGPKAEEDVVQIIEELRQRQKTDRVFVAGGSMGGTAALIFAALHPELVSGVCSLNGTANMIEYAKFQDAIASSYGGTKSEAPDQYRKRSAELVPERFTMPVAIATGGQDKTVPPQSALRLVEKLKQANRKVLSIHRETGGHSTTYEDSCAAMEFMLREAGPMVVDPQDLKEAADQLGAKLATLPPFNSDLLADAEVFHKGILWALRYETALTSSDIASIKTALARGSERAEALAANKTPWTSKKHPDRFVAIGPYCGYVDTHRFSETPIPGFIKVGPLPPHQETALHMLDSVDYAANAGVVPTIAAIGDKDTFFQAHVIMGEAFAKEGLPMVNLISPGTGHAIDPVTHAEQMRCIGEYAAKGLDHDPRQIRFVTWTLKYYRCHWLEVLGLGKHYERAEFRASVTDQGIEVSETKNIARVPGGNCPCRLF